MKTFWIKIKAWSKYVIAAEYLLIWWKCCFLQCILRCYFSKPKAITGVPDYMYEPRMILKKYCTGLGQYYFLYSPLQFRVLEQTFLGSKFKQFCLNYRVNFSPCSHCWKFPLVWWSERSRHAGISVVHGFPCRWGEKCICRIKVELRSWIANSAK